MADILIRGMEMPTQCGNCPISTNTRRCTILWREFGDPSKRLEDCPLVPIPEGHGRLVDAREVLEKADKASWFDGDVSELGLLLGSEVTTIVPAEGGGEG